MPASTVGPNGDTSIKTYDAIGRVATSTSPFGAVTTYSYDYTQHTVLGVTVEGVQGPLTRRFERTTYDGFGRTVRRGTTARGRRCRR
jgi:YD repeat-containing protein